MSQTIRRGPPWARPFPFLFAAIVALLIAAPFAFAAEKAFSISRGDAAATLQAFAEQSGEQVVYPPADVRGVQTNAVRGTLAPRVALERMLDGTKLEVIHDDKTGALAVRRASDPGASRVTPSAESLPSNSKNKEENSTIALEKYEVLGEKIDGPANQTIFRTSENGVFNYDIISRADIERMGVTNMEEFFRFVPQTSDYGAANLQNQVINAGAAGTAGYQNSEVKLRGFSSLQTSILINGRRLQRGFASSGTDLTRLPISAIERIEILPSSASAVYGGGAIGGVINIVLRKDYKGKDVTAYVGTSTDGGGTEWGVTYFEGRSFNDNRTRISTTVSYLKREPLLVGDRDYLQRALDRYPPNAPQAVSGRPIYEQYMIPAFAGNPGTIVINAATGGLGIPGNLTARYAAIPSGLNATQASALTPASFNSTANQLNLGERFDRLVLYRPEERYALTSIVEHVFIPDKLELYAEIGVNYMRSEYGAPQMAQMMNLAATDPLNPFRTGVTPGFVGVPITIYLDPTDLPDPFAQQDRRGARGVVGLKGKIGERWEWSIDGTGEYGRSHSKGNNPTQNLVPWVTGTATTGLNQLQRRAIYNPLADHSQFPAGAAFAPYYGYERDYVFSNNLGQMNLRVVGDVFDLPAGPLRLSPGAEVIWSQYDTNQQVITSTDYIAANGSSNTPRSYTRQGRRTDSAFLEAIVPVIGSDWRPIPLKAVNLNLAARWEGTDDSTAKTSPTAGIRVAINNDVAVRFAYSEGFFPPDQTQYEGSRTTEGAVTPGNDPFRGNTPLPARTEISGGNPDLLPETSKSWNYGVVLTPRFVPGLTLSADYWRIEKTNAIVNINGPSFVVAAPASYPGRVVRADPTPQDLAQGWLGVVTLIDWRPINVGYTFTEGVDLRMNYQRKVASLGMMTFSTTATYTDTFEDRILANSPIIERSGTSGNPLTWRGYSSLFFDRDVWTFGATVRYIDSYSADSTTPSPAFPTATGFDGAKISSATLWDIQVRYRIPMSWQSGGGWKSWLSATEFTLGVENIFNTEPAFRTDRFGFYSRYENPRQRFATLKIKKNF